MGQSEDGQPMSGRSRSFMVPGRVHCLVMQQLLAEMVHGLAILLPLDRRGLHPGLLFALDHFALGGLVIFAAPLGADARRLRAGDGSGRQQQGCRQQPYRAGPRFVVTPTLGWLPSARAPPPLLDLTPLSSCGETTVFGWTWAQAVSRPARRIAVMRTIWVSWVRSRGLVTGCAIRSASGGLDGFAGVPIPITPPETWSVAAFTAASSSFDPCRACCGSGDP